MPPERCIFDSRLPALACAATIALSTSETPGLASERTSSTVDVTGADDIAAAPESNGREIVVAP